MIEIEIEGPKLKGESTLLGFIRLPSVSMIRVHKYILLILGAALVVFDFAMQLPADISKSSDIENVDPNTLMAFPFIFFAWVLTEKYTYIHVCRQFRMLAQQESREITKHELGLLVESALPRLWMIRLFELVFMMTTWFVILNVLLICLISFW